VTDDDDENTITAQDVEWLNRTSVVRTAAFARLAGSLLVAVGVVGVAAALWNIVRYQQNAEGYSFGFIGGGGVDGEDVSTMDRVDLFSTTYGLVLPAIGLALGLALRLMADYTVVRVGGSLTGFEPGDEVPPETDDEDAADVVVPPPDPEAFEPGA
jgi:hypothetical protein